jgi:hypothetical protein
MINFTRENLLFFQEEFPLFFHCIFYEIFDKFLELSILKFSSQHPVKL